MPYTHRVPIFKKGATKLMAVTSHLNRFSKFVLLLESEGNLQQ